MNFLKDISLIVAIAVTFLLVNFSLNPKHSVAQQDFRWEYQAVSYESDLGRSHCVTKEAWRLNKYGEQGWELVLYNDIGDENGCKEALFKRPRIQ